MFKYVAIILIAFVMFASCSDDEPTTPSGDNFETVTIGTQVWMLKNLDVSTYSNGDPIPEVQDKNEWSNLTTGARCYYDNDPANGEIYGKLYNWHAVKDSRGLSPEGWHVPSDDEWKTLEMYLGMSQSEANDWFYRGTNEGSKLAGNYDLWPDGNLRNNTEFGTSGFTAIPGGYRDDGAFYSLGNYGYWFSSTEYSYSGAISRYVFCTDADVYRHDAGKEVGFSIRCVRD